tara:strand:+ start:632 stop:919 length:288 start_codon:yes stop_codon:yes gene_type:complete
MKVVITPDDDWFDPPCSYENPLDSMPIATDNTNPRPEEEIADLYASRHKSSPEFEKTAEEVVTMHEKMYRMATKTGGSWLGGSENCHGGSEQIVK